MIIKKILLFLIIFFGISKFSNLSCSDKESKLAEEILLQIQHWTSSMTEEKINKLILEIQTKCQKSKLNKQKVFDIIINRIDIKISYYSFLNKNPKSYKEELKILAFSANFALLSYISYRMYKNVIKRSEEVKNELRTMSTMPLIVSNGFASAAYFSHGQEKEVRNNLKALAYYSNTTHGSLSILCACLSFFSSFNPIQEILDKKYSDFYLNKYCLIKQMFKNHKDNL